MLFLQVTMMTPSSCQTDGATRRYGMAVVVLLLVLGCGDSEPADPIVENPPPAPLGFTNFFIGLQGGSGAVGAQLVPLADAPEGGVCKP